MSNNMVDKAIVEFLTEKKQAFLKVKIKQSMNDAEKVIVTNEADIKFSLKVWSADAANRAGQLSLSSHPPKFSHPDAKIGALIAQNTKANDGLLRSGNIETGLDVVGNAATLDVNKFLELKLANELSILQNLQQNTDYIKEQFDTDFDNLRAGFLAVIKPNSTTQSSDRLKQIYFPVEDDYHLLSLLTASGGVYQLKQRINEMKFSDSNKATREAVSNTDKHRDFSGKIDDVWGLTSIGYGGTKPQNISVLNNKNGGVAYLLSSMPPVLENRIKQPPKENFFDTIWLTDVLKSDFNYLNRIIQLFKNDKSVRNKRDEIFIGIADWIERDIEIIRDINNGWSDSPTYQKLEKWQKILLDDKYLPIRSDKEQNDNYQNKAKSAFAIWLVDTYNKLFESNFGDVQITHIETVMEQSMEAFK